MDKGSAIKISVMVIVIILGLGIIYISLATFYGDVYPDDLHRLGEDNNNDDFHPTTFYLSNNYDIKIENDQVADPESHTLYEGDLLIQPPYEMEIPLEVDVVDDIQPPDGSVHSIWHFYPSADMMIDGKIEVIIFLTAHQPCAGWIDIYIEIGSNILGPNRCEFELLPTANDPFKSEFKISRTMMGPEIPCTLKIRNYIEYPRNERSRESEPSEAVSLCIVGSNSTETASRVTLPLNFINVNNHVISNKDNKFFSIQYSVDCRIDNYSMYLYAEIVIITPSGEILYQEYLTSKNETRFSGDMIIRTDEWEEGQYMVTLSVRDDSNNEWFETHYFIYNRDSESVFSIWLPNIIIIYLAIITLCVTVYGYIVKSKK